MNQNTISLEFVKNHGCYAKGVIATFPTKIGQDMIKKQVAVEYIAPVSDEPKSKKKLPERQTATKSIITK